MRGRVVRKHVPCGVSADEHVQRAQSILLQSVVSVRILHLISSTTKKTWQATACPFTIRPANPPPTPAPAPDQLVRTKVHQKVELDRLKAANDAQFGTSRAASPQFKMSPEDLSAAAMIAPLAVAVLKVGPPKPPDAAASIVIGPAQAHICASSAGEGKPLVADPGVNKALKAKNERLALWNAFGKASAMTANQQEALQLIPLESHMPEVKLKDIFKGVVIKQLAKQQVKDGVQMKVRPGWLKHPDSVGTRYPLLIVFVPSCYTSRAHLYARNIEVQLLTRNSQRLCHIYTPGIIRSASGNSQR